MAKGSLPTHPISVESRTGEEWKINVETRSSICKTHHVISEGLAVVSGMEKGELKESEGLEITGTIQSEA